MSPLLNQGKRRTQIAGRGRARGDVPICIALMACARSVVLGKGETGRKTAGGLLARLCRVQQQQVFGRGFSFEAIDCAYPRCINRSDVLNRPQGSEHYGGLQQVGRLGLPGWPLQLSRGHVTL